MTLATPSLRYGQFQGGSMKKLLSLALVATMSTFMLTSCSEDRRENIGSNMEESMDDAGRQAEEFGRDVKQESCELINGKMECATERAGDSMEDKGDDVEDSLE
jgi:uncharacterized protein YgiB involved in biofilm formation